MHRNKVGLVLFPDPPCKRVSVKPGLWTGLDWTGLDWPKLLYTDSEHHQGYNGLSSALSQVAS